MMFRSIRKQGGSQLQVPSIWNILPVPNKVSIFVTEGRRFILEKSMKRVISNSWYKTNFKNNVSFVHFIDVHSYTFIVLIFGDEMDITCIQSSFGVTDRTYTKRFTRGVLLGIRGGGVLPDSPNPDPISDQNMPFSMPVFRPSVRFWKLPIAKTFRARKAILCAGYLLTEIQFSFVF